jgi:hypothetical protein
MFIEFLTLQNRKKLNFCSQSLCCYPTFDDYFTDTELLKDYGTYTANREYNEERKLRVPVRAYSFAKP